MYILNQEGSVFPVLWTCPFLLITLLFFYSENIDNIIIYMYNIIIIYKFYILNDKGTNLIYK